MIAVLLLLEFGFAVSALVG